MARTLTKKQRGFVNDYAETGNGVQSALKNYDTEDYSTAGVIAVENLEKPKIIEALKELGFDSNNARRVVGEILNNTEAENKDRLKAASLVFEVNGDNAAMKSVTINVDVPADPVLVKQFDDFLKERISEHRE